MRTTLLLVIALMLTLGCGKKDEDKTPAKKAVPAAKDPSTAEGKGTETPKPAEPAEPEAEVATQEDFEDEATKEITEKNLAKELGKIEDEIGD